MKAGAFCRDAWAMTEDMGLRTATMSTQWADTQDIRETWVGNCLVGTVPPQIPQTSYLAAAPGYPAVRELPCLSRQGDGGAGPTRGGPSGGTLGFPRVQVVR